MKFLCVECDEAMKLLSTEGPDEGSLTVAFGCPRCGRQVAMLTNPWETQLVRTLGVKVGGRATAAEPFEQIRSTLGSQREEAFVSAAADNEGPGCPFAAMIPGLDQAATGSVAWTPEAEARIERIPTFIRPMARKAIERFAEGKGYGTITEAVMDEARTAIGM